MECQIKERAVNDKADGEEKLSALINDLQHVTQLGLPFELPKTKSNDKELVLDDDATDRVIFLARFLHDHVFVQKAGVIPQRKLFYDVAKGEGSHGFHIFKNEDALNYALATLTEVLECTRSSIGVEPDDGGSLIGGDVIIKDYRRGQNAQIVTMDPAVDSGCWPLTVSPLDLESKIVISASKPNPVVVVMEHKQSCRGVASRWRSVAQQFQLPDHAVIFVATHGQPKYIMRVVLHNFAKANPSAKFYMIPDIDKGGMSNYISLRLGPSGTDSKYYDFRGTAIPHLQLLGPRWGTQDMPSDILDPGFTSLGPKAVAALRSMMKKADMPDDIKEVLGHMVEHEKGIHVNQAIGGGDELMKWIVERLDEEASGQ